MRQGTREEAGEGKRTSSSEFVALEGLGLSPGRERVSERPGERAHLAGDLARGSWDSVSHDGRAATANGDRGGQRRGGGGGQREHHRRIELLENGGLVWSHVHLYIYGTVQVHLD